MSYNVRELLNNFEGGLDELSKANTKEVNAFMEMLRAVYETKALDIKTKELISVGISCYNRCEYCIVYHTHKAFQAGATNEEVLEAELSKLGVTLEQMKEIGVLKLDRPYDDAYIHEGEEIEFETPTGKIELLSTELASLGFDAFPK